MTKEILPKWVYEDNSLGKLAMSLVGDEDASEIFSLLTNLMLVKMSARDITMKGVDGEIMGGEDLLPDDMPTCFQKPYGPRTMRIVEHLEKSGYIKLHVRNSRGCAYNIVLPPKSERAEWFNKALDSLTSFADEITKANERAAYWRKRAGVN
jgi:hypothetical protein